MIDLKHPGEAILGSRALEHRHRDQGARYEAVTFPVSAPKFQMVLVVSTIVRECKS